MTKFRLLQNCEAGAGCEVWRWQESGLAGQTAVGRPGNARGRRADPTVGIDRYYRAVEDGGPPPLP
jgi:hypothetical protein